jgi:enoyl-CoA hydratase/carnithine racemase
LGRYGKPFWEKGSHEKAKLKALERRFPMQETKLANVAITRKDRLAIVSLNRPEKLNALSPALVEDLNEALGEVAGDETIRCVIITGAGRSFSAGGDVQKDILPLREKSPSEFNLYLEEAMIMYHRIWNMDKPVIAAINGHAVGAGLDLAQTCDIRIAAEDAKLGEFFVRMGLVPESAIYLMPRLIGPGRAKLLSFTGDLIGAREAERIGLVDMVVAPDKLMTTAEELGKRMANGPKSISLIKKAFNECSKMTFESTIDYASRLQYQAVHTEDHKEAVASFLEKRPPAFQGR